MSRPFSILSLLNVYGNNDSTCMHTHEKREGGRGEERDREREKVLLTESHHTTIPFPKPSSSAVPWMLEHMPALYPFRLTWASEPMVSQMVSSLAEYCITSTTQQLGHILCIFKDLLIHSKNVLNAYLLRCY